MPSVENVLDAGAIKAVLYTVLTKPEILCTLPDACSRKEWVEAIEDRALRGDTAVYAAFVDGALAGVYLASPFDGVGLTMHQYVLAAHRRYSVEFGRMACAAALRDFPGVTHIVGLTPVWHRAAIRVAVMAGFKRCGVWTKWYSAMNGAAHDCQCLILLREDCHG